MHTMNLIFAFLIGGSVATFLLWIGVLHQLRNHEEIKKCSAFMRLFVAVVVAALWPIIAVIIAVPFVIHIRDKNCGESN